MRLIERNGVFAITDGYEYLAFLIPGKVYSWSEEEAPYFEYRLASTRGGRKAFWSCNDRGREILNEARYNPMFRGYVKMFMWAGPYDNLLSPAVDDDAKLPCVIQRGTGVLNYVVSFWRGVNDNVRAYLASLDLKYPLCSQGHLNIFTTTEPPDYVRESMRMKNPFQPQRFFNHTICGAKLSVLWRSIDGNAIGIIFTSRLITILSEDHEREPVFLSDGWYAISHPFPRPGRTVD
jgi:hypothetical protein